MKTRNLIYYICPMSTGIEWKLNVDAVKQFMHIFNGRKIVYIATQHPDSWLVDSPEEVIERFGDCGCECEFITGMNDSALCEVSPFMRMMHMLHDHEHDNRFNNLTFYAHAKTVSPWYSEWNGYKEKLPNMRVWRNLMYYFNLHDPKKIDNLLSRYSTAGCFLDSKPLPVWHYSGTYFWFRHDAIFSKSDWERIRFNRYGVEWYLGDFIREDQATSLFGDELIGQDITEFTPEQWDDVLKDHGLNYTMMTSGDFLK